MKVVFTDLSRTRLHEIQAYVAYRNPRAAIRVAEKVIYLAEMLGDHPHLGPLWDGGPTRMLVVSGLPYRIHYRLLEDAVEIITVAHTSQNPPRFL